MPRWVWVVLLLAVAAYGWRRTDATRTRGPHEVVAVNRSGSDLERVRISVGGHAISVPSLASGESATLPFRCPHEGPFRVTWRTSGTDGETVWEGGRFTRGPLPMRHRFELVRGQGVVWRCERLAASPAR